MSRVGKQPVQLNDKTTVEIVEGQSEFGGQLLKVKGGKGELEVHIRPEIKISQEDKAITVVIAKARKQKDENALWGLYRTLIQNAITGVNEGYTKDLEIVGIGYKVEKQGTSLKLNLGYNNLLEFPIPEGIDIKIKDGVDLTITGIDKQKVGETAATIRRMRKPEPYKGKGIRYKGEVIKLKQGKSAA